MARKPNPVTNNNAGGGWSRNLSPQQVAKAEGVASTVKAAQARRVNEIAMLGMELAKLRDALGESKNGRLAFKMWVERNTSLKKQDVARYIKIATTLEQLDIRGDALGLLSPETIVELSRHTVPMAAVHAALTMARGGQKVTKEKIRELQQKHSIVPVPKGKYRPQQDTDELGGAIPTRIVAAFASLCNWQISRRVRDMKKYTKEHHKIYGAWAQTAELAKTVAKLEHLCNITRPHCVCPGCDGVGCNWCRRTGWMPKWMRDNWDLDREEKTK